MKSDAAKNMIKELRYEEIKHEVLVLEKKRQYELEMSKLGITSFEDINKWCEAELKKLRHEIEEPISLLDADSYMSDNIDAYNRLQKRIENTLRVSNDKDPTPLLTDDEIDFLLVDNKLSEVKPSTESKLICPDCGSVFVKEGVKLFTSIEKHKCGNCGNEWI